MWNVQFWIWIQAWWRPKVDFTIVMSDQFQTYLSSDKSGLKLSMFEDYILVEIELKSNFNAFCILEGQNCFGASIICLWVARPYNDRGISNHVTRHMSVLLLSFWLFHDRWQLKHANVITVAFPITF